MAGLRTISVLSVLSLSVLNMRTIDRELFGNLTSLCADAKMRNLAALYVCTVTCLLSPDRRLIVIFVAERMVHERCRYVVRWKRKRMGILMKAGKMARGMAPRSLAAALLVSHAGASGVTLSKCARHVTPNHVTHTAEEPRQSHRHATKILPPTTDDLQI